MNASDLQLSLDSLQPAVIIWPLIFGLGLYLILTAQPIGRPRPDLGERLDRLDVDARIRDDVTRRDLAPIFASATMERILRPFLEDAGNVLRALLGRLGLARGHDLERKLAVTQSKVSVAEFWGEKLMAGLIGLGLCPLLNALDLTLFGPWPVWLWLVTFAVGFGLPDWRLERGLARRRERFLLELPSVIDLLCIAASAGLALEQAVREVARRSRGVVGQELEWLNGWMSYGGRSLMDGLEAMAVRNAIPEFSSLVGHLRAGDEQGVPLVQTLATQAETLRERKRVRLIDQGGRATAKMIIPVVLLILPALFVVEVGPAVLSALHSGG